MRSAAFAFLLVFLAMSVMGCSSSPLVNAIRTANTADIFADATHVDLHIVNKAAYDACRARKAEGIKVVLDCGKGVKKKYAKPWTAYRALRTSWLHLVALIKKAKADGVPPSLGELSVLVGKLVQSEAEMREAYP